MLREKKRIAGVFAQLQTLAPTNPELYPNIQQGDRGTTIITLTLNDHILMGIVPSRKMWLARFTDMRAGQVVGVSDPVVVATSMHTDDRVAKYAMSRAAEFYLDLANTEVEGEYRADRKERQKDLRNRCARLVVHLDRIGFIMPPNYPRTLE